MVVMSSTGTSATAATAAASARTSAGTGLAPDFGSFLKLLTAQLQNQDPLSPMDSEKFTSQLVQFSSVEQSLQTNNKLGQLVDMMRASSLTATLDYLGAEVEIDGSRLRLGSSGPADIHFQAAGAAASVQVRILDSKGVLVHQGIAAAEAGRSTYRWDGRGTDGGRVAAGIYHVEVTAADRAGRPVAIALDRRGVVQEVQTDTAGGLVLLVDGVKVPAEAVRTIHAAGKTSGAG